MAYMLDKIEATKYEVVSQQNGTHYLRLYFSDLDRSFAVGDERRRNWLGELNDEDIIDANESNRYQIETKAMPAAELKKTVQALLGRISAENRDIEIDNARREAERRDLLLAIGAVMGDIPNGEEQ